MKLKQKEAPAAIGPYSQGIIAGKFAFVSGQIPVNPKTGCVESDNIEGQAKQSLENVKAVLEEAGFKLSDVVKTTCFIADMNDFATFIKYIVNILMECVQQGLVWLLKNFQNKCFVR